MACDTDVKLRNKCIYSVYVRNHTKEGNFKGLISDLDRIKDLGIDYIWLMPIYPIGSVNRKGTLGSPYSIKDYRKINPEYGTMNDFEDLVHEVHKRDMKLIIDIVYNHTSYDSLLMKEHPEWFYKKNGHFGSKIGDWSDIADLDYSDESLWKYQIETLKFWISKGVDGFRCDVAPLVPLKFWKEARKEISKEKKGVIWIAETMGPSGIKALRDSGILVQSDCEMYESFDITYDYDTYEYFIDYLKGRISLEYFLEKKRAQEYTYPVNYVKLRFLENHDNPRIASLISDEILLENWISFMFFEKGASLIYAGQEYNDKNRPSLFEKDTVKLGTDKKFCDYIKNLVHIKKNNIFINGNYNLVKSKKRGVIEARYVLNNETVIGIFNVEKKIGKYRLDIKDGIYNNLINNFKISVKDNSIDLLKEPVILRIYK